MSLAFFNSCNTFATAASDTSLPHKGLAWAIKLFSFFGRFVFGSFLRFSINFVAPLDNAGVAATFGVAGGLGAACTCDTAAAGETTAAAGLCVDCEVS